MIEGEETTKEAAIIMTMTEAIKEEGTRTMNTTKKDSVETITMVESVVETNMRRKRSRNDYEARRRSRSRSKSPVNLNEKQVHKTIKDDLPSNLKEPVEVIEA